LLKDLLFWFLIVFGQIIKMGICFENIGIHHPSNESAP